MAKIDIGLPHFHIKLRRRSTTNCTITTLMSALTAAMIRVHRVEMW